VRGVYWPVPVKESEENTVWPVFRAFETLGYEWCEHGEHEAGIEKIAIYMKGDEPRHIAIQRSDGTWQSKLGPKIDIEHALESLESSDAFGPTEYGKVKYFMSRRRA
jgi:hypothetical protein